MSDKPLVSPDDQGATFVELGKALGPGDGAAIRDETDLHLQGQGGAELVFFDLPYGDRIDEVR